MKRTAAVTLTAIVLVVLITGLWAGRGHAFSEVNKSFFGVAIKGYDTVAYWTQGQAVKGKRKFSHEWNDAKWYFASERNRDLFASDPDRYAPQYGGH